MVAMIEPWFSLTASETQALAFAPSPLAGYGIREVDSVIGADGHSCQESLWEISRFQGRLPL
jgi:hypothetical protein